MGSSSKLRASSRNGPALIRKLRQAGVGTNRPPLPKQPSKQLLKAIEAYNRSAQPSDTDVKRSEGIRSASSTVSRRATLESNDARVSESEEHPRISHRSLGRSQSCPTVQGLPPLERDSDSESLSTRGTGFRTTSKRIRSELHHHGGQNNMLTKHDEEYYSSSSGSSKFSRYSSGSARSTSSSISSPSPPPMPITAPLSVKRKQIEKAKMPDTFRSPSQQRRVEVTLCTSFIPDSPRPPSSFPSHRIRINKTEPQLTIPQGKRHHKQPYTRKIHRSSSFHCDS
ncbi:hypothetical protein E1B28_013306 [Marasmius oreades]|uniref:Uncharacterized protein n=1 Tax=Marasmius oreades TaxID=181124 RepID=A0A9P7UNW0_9AGAR|nr:uncharacterized protein E1B28_013306 [Marasmius oreades]KAG7087331.1 hypothetical protein E1B28_013306 [Marasmius oreades]